MIPRATKDESLIHRARTYDGTAGQIHAVLGNLSAYSASLYLLERASEDEDIARCNRNIERWALQLELVLRGKSYVRAETQRRSELGDFEHKQLWAL